MSRHHKATPAREWEGIRQKALAEQGRRCGKCGKAGRMEVHHKVELQRGGTNAQSNLLVLCRDCHIAAHRPVMGEQELAWQVLLAETRGVVN